jgi:transcriptional regulator with XRE-family HTH domain
VDTTDAVPEGAANEGGAILARNLRRVRQLRGVTLSALARESRVARATLYQMEAGDGNPTIDTLWAVSNVLKVPLSELVTDSEPPAVQVIRAPATPEGGERGAITRLIRRFSSSSGLLELHHLQIMAGEATEGHPHPTGVHEHVLVTRGTLTTGPDDHLTELGPGDYISFRADGPHRYQAGPDEMVIATLVMDYPPTMNLPHEQHLG